MNVDFHHYLDKTGEVGFVRKIFPPLLFVEGLPTVRPAELVIFESGGVAQVTAFDETFVELLCFSKELPKTNTRVVRTNELLTVPVGKELLGSIINPLGHSIDPARPIPQTLERRLLEVSPPGIHTRAKIKRPLPTGVFLSDLLLPIGKGQRELILGDQKTGKTRFVTDTLGTQVREGAIAVYAAIGKGQLIIKQVEEALRQNKILDRTILVVAEADAGAGMLYLAPYTAMTIAEFFRDQGNDVVLVLDDLSTHAKAYREISLVGKKFPGRNSYPGDIFYTHARLLERAGNFNMPNGEVSITCLPIVETMQGDLTGYISSNIMSMTDGHIFFDQNLFVAGRRPAINPFLSVTRVGRQTQSKLQNEISRSVVTFLKNVEQMHNFASFGAELGEHIKIALAKEEQIFQLFDQSANEIIPKNVQIILFGFVWGDTWIGKTMNEIRSMVQKFVFFYEARPEVKKVVDEVAASNSVAELLKKIQQIDTKVFG